MGKSKDVWGDKKNQTSHRYCAIGGMCIKKTDLFVRCTTCSACISSLPSKRIRCQSRVFLSEHLELMAMNR